MASRMRRYERVEPEGAAWISRHTRRTQTSVVVDGMDAVSSAQ